MPTLPRNGTAISRSEQRSAEQGRIARRAHLLGRMWARGSRFARPADQVDYAALIHPASFFSATASMKNRIWRADVR